MSRFHNPAALLLAGAVLATTAARAGMPARNLQVWRAEGNGDGTLAHYRPAAVPGYYHIGSTPSAAAIAGWTIAVPPDGANLPQGSGTPAQGATVYAGNCAMCHGSFGEGKNNYPALVGGVGSLASAAPEKGMSR